MTQSTIIEAEYRASGYTDEEMAEFSEQMSELGATRTRPLYLPAAGGCYDIGLILTFVGVSAASRIVGNLATDVVKKFVSKLIDYYGKRESEEKEPEIFKIAFTFDDLEIIISANEHEFEALNVYNLKNIPGLWEVIVSHVSSGPIVDQNFLRIEIEARCPGDLSDAYMDTKWKVGYTYYHASHYYDTQTKAVTKIESEAGEL